MELTLLGLCLVAFVLMVGVICQRKRVDDLEFYQQVMLGEVERLQKEVEAFHARK
jgi:hypothetical protein